MTHPTTPTHLSPLTPAQAEALVRLLAKATKDGGLPQRGAQPQVEAYEGGPR
jgi:hypothetical protein